MLKKYTEIIAVVLVVRKDQKHEYKKKYTAHPHNGMLHNIKNKGWNDFWYS